MNIAVDFWDLLKLLIGFAGVLFGFGKLLLAQIDKRIDTQTERLSDLEKELADHKIRMPLEYQRREDAIRFETVLNAKLDGIHGLIERLRDK